MASQNRFAILDQIEDPSDVPDTSATAVVEDSEKWVPVVDKKTRRRQKQEAREEKALAEVVAVEAALVVLETGDTKAVSVDTKAVPAQPIGVTSEKDDPIATNITKMMAAKAQIRKMITPEARVHMDLQDAANSLDDIIADKVWALERANEAILAFEEVQRALEELEHWKQKRKQKSVNYWNFQHRKNTAIGYNAFHQVERFLRDYDWAVKRYIRRKTALEGRRKAQKRS